MSVIAYTADAGSGSDSSALFSELLQALSARFPDTLVLAVCRHPPAEAPPQESRDWVCIGNAVSEDSIPRLLAAIARTHQSAALVQVPADDGRSLDLGDTWAPGEQLVVTRGEDLESALGRLDAVVPAALVLGPQTESTQWEAVLETRSAAPLIHLYWTGGLVPELLNLCTRVLAIDRRPVRLQLGLPELVRGTARRVLLAIPQEIELRVVAEDEYSRGVALGAQAILRTFRRERPRTQR